MTNTEVVTDKPTTLLPEDTLPRPVIRLSDFDGADDADLTNMFGTWKEADHCDIEARK